MTQRPWNCICNSPQHQAFCKCLQMINSLEIGKTIWEMFMSEMALLWEIIFCREVSSVAGFSVFWACCLFAHWSPTFCCLNIKTRSVTWLWRSCDQALQRPIVSLSIGTWAELRRKVFGPVARKLAWLSSTDVLEKALFSSLPGIILTPCCPHEDELMLWGKKKKKTTKNTSRTVK